MAEEGDVPNEGSPREEGQEKVEEESDTSSPMPQPKKKGVGLSMVEEEAAEDENDDDESSEEGRAESVKRVKAISAADEEDEDEDEDVNEYQHDDFLVDDAEVEHEVGGEGEGEGEREGEGETTLAPEGGDEEVPRKRHRREDAELDEDDLVLIEENLGVRLPRREEPQRGRLKRLKKIEEVEQEIIEGNDEEDTVVAPRVNEAEALKAVLFGDDDEIGEDVEDAHRIPPPRNIEEEEEELDEEDDFIDYEGGKAARRRGRTVFTSEELEEAAEIFGDLDGFLGLEEEEEEREAGAEEFEMIEEEVEEGIPPEEQEASFDLTDLSEPAVVTHKVRRLVRKKKSRRDILAQKYEPGVIEAAMLTEWDDRMRKKDVPERYQLRYSHLPAAEDEITEEAHWIRLRAFPTFPDSAIERIKYVLDRIRNGGMDIPFIETYRSEYWIGEGPSHAPNMQLCLWTILEYDDRWCYLRSQKQILEQALQRLPSSAPTVMWGGLLFKDILRDAKTEEELCDAKAFFELHYAHVRNVVTPPYDGIPYQAEGTQEVAEVRGEDHKPLFRRPERRDIYSTCRRGGLLTFAAAFGLSASQFGNNVLSGFKQDIPRDGDRDPEDMANDYVGGEFASVESVMRVTMKAMAMEIAFDPLIRQRLRGDILRVATVTTRPTLKGRKEIDGLHPYAHLRHIDSKPVLAIQEEIRSGHSTLRFQLLEISKAEEEEFITVDIGLNEEARERLLTELEQYYLSENFDDLAQRWNEQRRLILRYAFDEFLVPSLGKEIRTRLMFESRKALAELCANRLREMIDKQPPKPSNLVHPRRRKTEAHRVVSVVYSEAEQVVVVVLLDHDGRLVDWLQLKFFLGRGDEKAPQVERDRKSADRDRFKRFLSDASPEFVCIGASSLACQRLFMDTRECFKGVCPNLFPDDLPEDDRSFPVQWVDVEVARVVMNSDRAKREFPDHPPLIRYAVSLARFFQEPLVEVAGLASSPDDLLSLRFHSHQGVVPVEERIRRLHRVLIDVSNKVGADINRMIELPHTAGPLQFISGLGPRKAQQMLHSTGQGRYLTARSDLITREICGKCIFENCAGFIRIRLCKEMVGRVDLDALDDTRIHPESYDITLKMATDALEPEEGQMQQMCLEELMKEPERMRDIDLDALARGLEDFGRGRKHDTVYAIANEIERPFWDKRKPHSVLNRERLFTLLTGEENPMRLVGQLASAVVVSIPRFDEDDANRGASGTTVVCRLESGLKAFLRLEDISDTDKSPAVVQRLQRGRPIVCKIREIDMLRVFARISTCSGDLQRTEYSACPDATYCRHYEIEEERRRAEARRERARKFVHRTIKHPAFRNFSLRQAGLHMKSRDVGEAIYRPSSKGPDHLVLTWKFFDGIIVHFVLDVKEMEKPPGEPLALGRKLMIETLTFDDLDEILARYIEPMNGLVQEMMEHKKFKFEPVEVIDDIAKKEKATSPGSIPYYIGFSGTHPGFFSLSYVPARSVRHEYIRVTHEGYKIRKTFHQTPDHLIRWFKKNYRNLPRHEPPAMVQPAAPMYWDATAASGWTGQQQRATNWDAAPYAAAPQPWRAAVQPAPAASGWNYTAVPPARDQWPREGRHGADRNEHSHRPDRDSGDHRRERGSFWNTTRRR